MQGMLQGATSVALGSFVLALGACSTTRKDAHEYVDQGVQAVDRTSRTQIAIAQADPDLDQAVLATYAGQFETDAAASAAQLAAVRKRIEEQESQLRAVVEALASSALEILPGGRGLTELAGAVGRGLRGSDEKLGQDVRESESRSARQAEAAKERSETALARADRAETAAREAVDAVDERVRTAQAALSEQTRELLAGVRGDLDSLRASAGDTRQFQQELDRYLKSAGLSPEQVAEFKRSTDGLSTTEIVALLSSILLGAGGGVTASRMGKSRSSEEVDALWKESENLRRSLTNMSLEVTRAMPNVRISEPGT